MQRSWIIGGAGVLGLALAFLMFGTSGDVVTAGGAPPPIAGMPTPGEPAPAGTPIAPGAPGVAPPVPGTPEVPLAPGRVPMPGIANDADPSYPSAATAEALARMNTPEAVYSGRLSGPWTIARRDLIRANGDQQLIADLNDLIGDLRDARRTLPDAPDFATLEQRQRALLGRMRSVSGLPAETSEQLKRVEDLLTEFHSAPKVPGPPPTPSAPSTPPPATP